MLHARMRLAILLVFGLLISLAAAPAPRPRTLKAELNRVLAGPDFQHGFWGVYVYDLTRQRVLYDHNGERWFTPASNAKLFTLAAALKLLGPDYRFRTVVATTTPPNAQGVIAGDVALVGVGDPSLSGRPYPYHLDPAAPALPYDPEVVPRRLAAQLAARGVKRIAGAVIGDDSYFTDDPYPQSWAIGDMLWDYGAPVSALTLNDNTRFLQIFPGTAAGDAPRLAWAPALDPPPLELALRTGARGSATRIHLQTDPVSGALRIEGSIAADSHGVLEALAVRHPALYAAELLRQALEQQGIRVTGGARARHLIESGQPASPPASGRAFELVYWESPPLSQILQVTAKVSQNLEAELLLRLLGKLHGTPAAPGAEEASSDPELRAGEAVVDDFLRGAGLAATDTALVDGSGLSRTDLVTPAGIVRLLRYMAGQPQAAVWRGLLPIAGADGTLEHRFVGERAAGRLHGKTGSLSHVNSLSGYVRARNGDRLAFALLSNNVNRPAARVRGQLDRLAEVLAAW